MLKSRTVRGDIPPPNILMQSHGAAAAQILPGAFINIVPVSTAQPALDDLQRLAGVMKEPAQDPPAITRFDNRAIPAGYTYFSQFVDHDLTGQNSNALVHRPEFNKRTAALDLDSLYGTETIDSRVGDRLRAITPAGLARNIYDPSGVYFVIETTASGANDLPRVQAADGTRGDPIVPDGRNDENLIVSQLDLAFLRFHNAVAADIAGDGLTGSALFSAAYRVVVEHYQWIVLHDFLPRLVAGRNIPAGRAYVERVRRMQDRRYTKADVLRGMPAEFSVAAYRLGHSMVRFNYQLNDRVNGAGEPLPERQIFNDGNPSDDLHGHREYPDDAIIAWHRFLDFAKDAPQTGDPAFGDPQFSMLLDTGLSRGLSMLPNFSFLNPGEPAPAPVEHVLAYRNLVKGTLFGLPTGQEVARFYDLDPRECTVLTETTVPNPLDPNSDFSYGQPDAELTALFGTKTPLWYYILKEAQDPEGPAGEHLGELGKRIVTECFLAFLEASPVSIFDTNFSPAKGAFGCVENGEYNLSRLVRFATGQ